MFSQEVTLRLIIETTQEDTKVPKMARNSEVIRQWRILREVEAAHGITIRQMAELTGVTTRTIRRDLDALQEAGFALYDELYDGQKRWKLDTRPFKRVIVSPGKAGGFSCEPLKAACRNVAATRPLEPPSGWLLWLQSKLF